MNFVKGIKTNLVEVSEVDSKSIIELRNNPSINRFLSSSKEITIEQQVEWIKRNRLASDSYYFKITDSAGNFFGTISLYSLESNQAEFGRFISKNPIHAVEAEYLIIRFGFEILNLKRIYCRTVIENKTVWNQHYKFGFKDVQDVVLDQKSGFSLKVQEITKEIYLNFDYSSILRLISRF